jgi:hypothetical protein
MSGDFRDSYSIMAIISPNPQKPYPMDYTIGKGNGTSEAFVGFLTYLIANLILLHNRFLLMDNATISMASHCMSSSSIFPPAVWN